MASKRRTSKKNVSEFEKYVQELGKYLKDFAKQIEEATKSVSEGNETKEEETKIIGDENIGDISEAQKKVDEFTQSINSLNDQISSLEKALKNPNLTAKEKETLEKRRDDKISERDKQKEASDLYNKVTRSNGLNVSGRTKEQVERDDRATKKLNSITEKFGYETKIENGSASFKNKKKEDITAVGDAVGSIGRKIGKLGGIFGKLGGIVSKVGGLLKGFAGPIGWAITAIQMLGDAAEALAETDAKMQDIQNQRNTNLTNRNISLQNTETEGTVDAMNTVFENMMSDYNKAFVKLSGELAITNAKAVAYAETRIGAAIGDVNETAWNALAASTDIKAQEQKLGNAIEKTEATENRAISQRNTELAGRNVERSYQSQKTVLDSQKKDFELTTQDKENSYNAPISSMIDRAAGSSTEADAVYGDSSGKYNKQYGKGEKEGIESRGVTGSTALGVVNTATLGIGNGLFHSGLTKQKTEGTRDFTNFENELNAVSASASNQVKMQNAVIANSNKMADRVTSDIAEMKDSVIDTNTQIEKAYQKMAQQVEKWYMDFQDKSYESGINKGMTSKGQLDQYRQAMNQNLTSLASKYGINADEMYKMQSGYTAEGRSKMLSGEDMKEQGAFSKIYMGGDFSTTAELSNNMEVFNMGVSDTVNLMGEMSKQVTKMGLDGRKYLKDAVKYLKQAQKYTFKDGVKGMLKMAKTAQQIRFNMDSVPAMIDNIQDGGLEGIITKAAKLQVLGGRFAMGSDPIAMAYEAYNDPEALMKRFNSMTQGMGSFNNKTGEVTFNGMEQQQLKLLAEYTNQDVTDVMNQARYNVKKDKIDKSQISSDLDETQRASLISKAYMKDGKWMVNDVEGNARDLSSINANNIKDVQADTYEGKMSQGMEKIVSFTKLFEGDQTSRMSQFSSAMQASGQADKELQDRLQKSKDEFEQEFNKNMGEVLDNMHKATVAYSDILNQFKESNPNAKLEDVTGKIKDDTKDIKDVLTQMLRTMGGDAGNAAADKMELTKKREELSNKLKGLKFGVGDKQISAEELIQKGAIYQGKTGGLKINQTALQQNYGSDKLRFGNWTQKQVQSRLNTKDGIYYTGGRLTYAQMKEKEKYNPKYESNKDVDWAHRIGSQTSASTFSENGESHVLKTNKKKVNDGSVSGGGKPMAVSANKVTPINDGSVSGAISDPNDHAIFAKVGGPFDTLFNGVFKQVNALYQGLFGNTNNNNVTPKEPLGKNSEFAISGMERFNNIFSEANKNSASMNSCASVSNNSFKIEINGKLTLDSNGQSVDIINELKKNPLMLQALSNMIASNISAKTYGGRPLLDASFRN